MPSTTVAPVVEGWLEAPLFSVEVILIFVQNFLSILYYFRRLGKGKLLAEDILVISVYRHKIYSISILFYMVVWLAILLCVVSTDASQTFIRYHSFIIYNFIMCDCVASNFLLKMPNHA